MCYMAKHYQYKHIIAIYIYIYIYINKCTYTYTAITPPSPPITAGLTDNCVECIGVASGGRGSTGCNPLCGPFGLKWRYWSDCDKPGS